MNIQAIMVVVLVWFLTFGFMWSKDNISNAFMKLLLFVVAIFDGYLLFKHLYDDRLNTSLFIVVGIVSLAFFCVWTTKNVYNVILKMGWLSGLLISLFVVFPRL